QAKGVPFGPIFSPAELLETEQYVARGFLAELEHPTLGRLRMPQLPVQWNGHSFAPRPAPNPPHSNGEVPPSYGGGGVISPSTRRMTPPSRMTAPPPPENGEGEKK